ncbi:MAG: amino acid adenylation domain-containing protein [Verrucomicrobiales bacterium]|nr:amino acid adenylation domain-containing protein [Verrucomicrobiales bacterium]
MSMHSANRISGLISGFWSAAKSYPDRPALWVEEKEYSYQELAERSLRLAAALLREDPKGSHAFTAVFASRSLTAYLGVLAALHRGHGYLPLNPAFPTDRSAYMLLSSEAVAIIVDQNCLPLLPAVLQSATTSKVVLLPDVEDVDELRRTYPQHRIVSRSEIETTTPLAAPRVPDTDYAYLLFTSGSTGMPKGVLVSQSNVRHYVQAIAARHQMSEVDRCSQTFEMTFDLSAHDMFVTWEAGACLCCPTSKALLKPGGFIRDSKLTVWFSVPSTAVFMKRFGVLKPGMYPSLRLSLFCGEPLPVEVVKAWESAAPQSVIENLYGPTELTIACTAYQWHSNRSPEEAEHGVVPIGEPLDRMSVLVAAEDLTEVQPGEEGELLMTGPQLSLGYWKDPERSNAAFVRPRGRTEVFYRTGDRVRRPAAGQPLIYLGRMDNQIKVLGHRVELGEVEAALRDASGVDAVIALGWPLNPSGAGGIEAFLQTESVDESAVLAQVAARLPTYMTPRRLHCLPSFPLNSNGKYDRKALLKILANSP